MPKHSCSFSAKVWLYPGVGGWHFVYLPKSEVARVADMKVQKVGFGFIPVTATIGTTSWRTTVFPSKKEGTYLLALKAMVRKKEQIVAGDMVRVTVVFAA